MVRRALRRLCDRIIGAKNTEMHTYRSAMDGLGKAAMPLGDRRGYP